MGVYQIIGSEIRRHGSHVTVTTDGAAINARAFVQPLRYRNRIYIGGEYRDIGKIRREKYLYVGTADCALTEDRSVIDFAGGQYIVKRCETYYWGDEPVYVWAILVPYGAPREDEYDADTATD